LLNQIASKYEKMRRNSTKLNFEGKELKVPLKENQFIKVLILQSNERLEAFL